VKRLNSEASALYKVECRVAADKIAKGLRAAVEAVGGKVVVIALSVHHVNDRFRNEDKLLEQTVKVSSGKGNGFHECCNFVATVEPSSGLTDLESAIVTAKADVAELQVVALGWRRKLSHIPMLERQARAKVAETKLKASDEGQELLDVLTDDFDAQLLALPGN